MLDIARARQNKYKVTAENAEGKLSDHYLKSRSLRTRYVCMCVRVYVALGTCVCVYMCMCACMYVCMCAHVYVYMHVHACLCV